MENIIPQPVPVEAPSAPNVPALPSIITLLKEAWSILKNRFLIIIGVSLLPMLLFAGIAVLAVAGVGGAALLSKVAGGNSGIMAIIVGLIAGVALFAGLLYVSGWMQAALVHAVSSPEKVGVIESYRRARPRAWAAFWVNLVVGIIVMIGFILLIIPGIVFMVWYMFSMYTLVLENRSSGDAMKASKALVQGRWFAIFGRLVAMIGLILLITFGLNGILDALDSPPALSFVSFLISIALGLLAQCYTYRLYVHARQTRP